VPEKAELSDDSASTKRIARFEGLGAPNGDRDSRCQPRVLRLDGPAPRAQLTWRGVVRLITWNVAGRSRRLPEQAAAVAARAPDIIALQEVTRRTRPLWNRAFELMGLANVSASSLGGELSGAAVGRRTLVMVAARVALEELRKPLGVPRPESALSVVARLPSGP